ncbi:PREDICTED: tRNA (cytosine(34)-C(5))-methyltransferase-like [Rhagoletis zephyria]|uniref:tRNA (cytosine(34)-C(5))-methyltransferase-like n=1 Tax=Rhagoletis zephyria TaxID=28612 RepID=UPI00081150DB|nr:PREDICTED: tRNA (cytosine(34)-C(5))-methyltransferase-like [Rhagoletis zephyria]
MPTFYKTSSSAAEDGSKTTKTPLKFDRVLADVPCTGDGTLRKNYDVWTKWNAANSNNFHHMQAKIARRGLELLAKDGLMAYSTCSLNPSEDESVVASLLNDSKGALELVDAAATLPELKHLPGLEHWTVMSRDGVQYTSYEEVPEKLRTQIRETLFPPANAAELRLRRCVRILPHYQNTGGFFIAILRKKTDRMPWEPTEEEEEAKKREQEEEEEKKKKEEEAAGEGGGADKTEEDKTSLTTGRGGKKRQFFGYKEVPFSFLTKDDADWADIKSFFKLPESFNVQQLAHRCAVGKRRNLYFFTERAADFVALNGHVKIISGGCRVFCRVDISQVPCAFRVSQEGIPSLFPYFVPHLEQYAPVVDSTEANPKRTFTITDLDLETFVKVLRQEEVKIELLPPATRSKLEGVTHGGAILYTKVARPPPNSSSTFMVALCAWKGRNSVRAYVARNEKLHLMRLCGVEEPKLDTPTAAKKEGQDVKKAEEEPENGNGDNQQEEDEEESAPLKKCKLDEEEKEKVEA